MSVSINSDADGYTASLGLGTVTEWAFTGWVKLATIIRTSTTVPLQIDDGSGGTFYRLNFYDGDTPTYQTTASPEAWFSTLAGLNMATQTWYYFGISGRTTSPQHRFCFRTDGSMEWTGNSGVAQTNTSIIANTIRIGRSHTSNNFIDGSMCCVKMWNAFLTRDELQEESFGFLPRRSQDLVAWYPFLTADPTDMSGNGFHLTPGTAVIDAGLGPALPWTTAQPLFVDDAIGVVDKDLEDSGQGDDSLGVSGGGSLAETGEASDSLTVTVSVALTDAGAAVDDAGLASATDLDDEGSADDALIASPVVMKILTDTGSADDSISKFEPGEIAGVTAPYVLWESAVQVRGLEEGAPFREWEAALQDRGMKAAQPRVLWEAGKPMTEEA